LANKSCGVISITVDMLLQEHYWQHRRLPDTLQSYTCDVLADEVCDVYNNVYEVCIPALADAVAWNEADAVAVADVVVMADVENAPEQVASVVAAGVVAGVAQKD